MISYRRLMRLIFPIMVFTLVGLGTVNLAAENDTPIQTLPPSESYRATWAKKSVQILEQSGIHLPETVDYDQLILKKDFDAILSKVTTMDRRSFYSLVDKDSRMNAQDRISRGAAIDSLIRAFGLAQSISIFSTEETTFKDLPPNHPAYAAIVMAENTHLINGYPDKTIKPDEPLSWGEALILIETIYTWRQALPTEAPGWVKNYQKQQNTWFQFIDGLRLLLTLVYGGLALIFLLRSFLQSRKTKEHPFKPMNLLMLATTLILLTMWSNELLYTYGITQREIYQIFALLSVFAGLLLLKTGTYMYHKMSEPKPQAVIDVGYVDAVNLDKGELFIVDALTKKHSLALMTPNTRIYNQENNLLNKAFLSEIKVGNFVKIKGSSRLAGSIIDIDKLLLIASQTTEVRSFQESRSKQIQTQPRYNKIFRKQPPRTPPPPIQG